MGFFNSSQAPTWDHPEAFDQVFSGTDVVFRDIRVTAVCKKIELDTCLDPPQVNITEPMQNVKKLWNASERSTVAKQDAPPALPTRSRMTFDRAEMGFTNPKEIGDVEVMEMR